MSCLIRVGKGRTGVRRRSVSPAVTAGAPDLSSDASATVLWDAADQSLACAVSGVARSRQTAGFALFMVDRIALNTKLFS
ncbi:MAG: hypothetical protein JSW71_12055 [Gemmatimonadota bacterium]|nr:MAG: hypothetical protein JSW71_12055 [Gemmatimonadota bacterium]